MGFENYETNSGKFEPSEDVREQLENLGLPLSEIKGTILDIGAGDGQFAKDLENVTDVNIISLDSDEISDSEKSVVSDARGLPFKDGSFDKVVSHASIPNVFINMYSSEFSDLSKNEIKSAILRSFNEILRVLKSGSSAVFAPVRIAQNYESEKDFSDVFYEVLREIESKGVETQLELIEEVENPENKERSSLYRLIVYKK
ncbi:MAG: methyltransferase domain-containing protein [Patescibacteria group bacterium]